MPSLLMVYLAVMVSGFSVSVMMAVVVVPTVCSLVVWVPSSRMVVTIIGVPFQLLVWLSAMAVISWTGLGRSRCWTVLFASRWATR